MAYDLKLAERIRSQLDGIPFVEKKMFGGVGFLLNGNTPALPGTVRQDRCAPGASVACGVNKDDPVVHVDPERHSALLNKPHTKPFDLTGKPMKGWPLIKAEGFKTNRQLSAWVKKGVKFASMLPPK